jgi:light-harvesting protein B-800-850 alpha chain
MNNAKIWLVVKPTVGVPLFLTAVAVASFSVHVAVLRNTTWVSKFLDGKTKAKTASNDSVPLPATGASATVTFSGGNGTDAVQEATIVLPDGRTGKVVFSALPGSPNAKGATTAMATELPIPK